MITYIGTGPIPSTEQGEIYYRKHFDLPSNPPSRLGVVLQTSSPLIVYLNEVNEGTATRVKDILSGAIYALGGGMVMLQKDMYMFTPDGVNQR